MVWRDTIGGLLDQLEDPEESELHENDHGDDTVLDTAEIFELTHDTGDQDASSDTVARFTPAMGAQLDEALGLNKPAPGQAKKKKKVRRRANELPPNLMGEMGEANAMYASGCYNEAAVLLLEVVRQAPRCPDPYQTLGLIYEEMGDPKKALEYYMMAAHLLPKQIEGWKQVFRSWLGFGNFEQAAYCIQKAYKIDAKDVEVLQGRAELFALHAEHTGDPEIYKKAVDSAEVLASVQPPSLEMAMDMARYSLNACSSCTGRIAHACSMRGRGIAFIEIVLQEEAKGAHEPDPKMLLSTLNILMELYLEDEAYQHAVDLIERWRGSVPKLPLDLTAKYAVCEIYLGRAVEAQRHIRELLQQDAAEYDDLFYDVAEAYRNTGSHAQALELYEQLRSSPSYNAPEVWFKIGKCHKAIGNLESAKQILQEVHEAAPGYEEVTHILVELYRGSGQADLALETIQQTAEVAPDALVTSGGRISELQLLQLNLLLQQGDQAAFLDGCLEPLQHELQDRVRSRDKERKDQLLEHKDGVRSRRRFVAIGLAAMAPEAVAKLVTSAARALSKLGRGTEGTELLNIALSTDLFSGEANVQCVHSLRLALVETSWQNQDLDQAYRAMCAYCLSQPYSIDAWCVYNEIAQRAGMWYKIHRPLIRALLKHPDSVPMTVLVGHHMTASGRLKLAVGEYFRAYRAMPEQPLISLCIGVSLLRLSMHKNAVNRHKVVMHAFAFFEQYAKLRDSPAESNYNLGRAFHQLGLFHLAIPYYKKVLASVHGGNTMQREAAYNLSLIYSKSGSPELASHLLRSYVRI